MKLAISQNIMWLLDERKPFFTNSPQEGGLEYNDFIRYNCICSTPLNKKGCPWNNTELHLIVRIRFWRYGEYSFISSTPKSTHNQCAFTSWCSLYVSNRVVLKNFAFDKTMSKTRDFIKIFFYSILSNIYIFFTDLLKQYMNLQWTRFPNL